MFVVYIIPPPTSTQMPIKYHNMSRCLAGETLRHLLPTVQICWSWLWPDLFVCHSVIHIHVNQTSSEQSKEQSS